MKLLGLLLVVQGAIVTKSKAQGDCLVRELGSTKLANQDPLRAAQKCKQVSGCCGEADFLKQASETNSSSH